MVRIRPVEDIVRRWKIGMLTTPPVECPRCGKKTRCVWRCQWCKSVWTKEESEIAKKRRLSLMPNLATITQREDTGLS